jgi:membrane protease YdiL (CAAX protease family)
MLPDQEKARLSPEPSDRREQLYEVSVFLFLFIPSMIFSFFVMRGQGSADFVMTAVFTILRDLGLVALLLFFLWRNGESWNRLGWTFENGWKEIFLGAVLFVPTFFIAGLIEGYLQAAGFSAPKQPLPAFLEANGNAELLLAFFLVVVVAIAEETIFRGYLLLRFQGLKLGTIAAVLLSALIFSLGHGYEGASGVITVFFLGTVFALIYLWRQCLLAPIVMHFLQDFTGIVLAPWLGLK